MAPLDDDNEESIPTTAYQAGQLRALTGRDPATLIDANALGTARQRPKPSPPGRVGNTHPRRPGAARPLRTRLSPRRLIIAMLAISTFLAGYGAARSWLTTQHRAALLASHDGRSVFEWVRSSPRSAHQRPGALPETSAQGQARNARPYDEALARHELGAPPVPATTTATPRQQTQPPVAAPQRARLAVDALLAGEQRLAREHYRVLIEQHPDDDAYWLVGRALAQMLDRGCYTQHSGVAACASQRVH